MLDVEIVVLDIGKHGARQAELAFERGAGVRVEQFGIFLRDAVALGGDLRSGAVDLLASLDTDDVIPDVAERDIEVLDPVFVGRIEAVSGREIEPGILRLLPRLEPLMAVRPLRDRRQRRVSRAGPKRGCDVELHRELGQLLQFIVGPEQIDIDALHHLGNRLVGNVGELSLEEAEEIQIGGIAEVQKLEMILPGLVEKLDRPVVGLHQAVGVIETDALR